MLNQIFLGDWKTQNAGTPGSNGTALFLRALSRVHIVNHVILVLPSGTYLQ